MKKIIKNIFSVTNIKQDNYTGIQIKFLGLKIKLRDKMKILKERMDKIEQGVNEIIDIITVSNFKEIKSATNIPDKSKYKSNFLLFKYNYLNIPPFCSCVNLGDYIQTIATRNVINSLYSDVKFEYWDRDNLSNYVGNPAFTIMQGWFSHSSEYLPNDKILPVFIGTHITTSKRKEFIKFVQSNYEYFKTITFGCRDTSTLNFLRDIGLKSYLSRCLTLTLPKREEKTTQNKVYIVDIPDNMLKYMPKKIKENCVYKNQRSIDCDKEASFYVNTEEMYIKRSSDLLQEYRDNAELVITSALHCASPCIAMGIPTILIDFENKNDRFGSLDGIFNIYTKHDLISGKIDFNPNSVDLEELKKLMIKNVELSIKNTFDESIDIYELNTIREKIENYHFK